MLRVGSETARLGNNVLRSDPMKRILIIAIAAFVSASCTPVPPEKPVAAPAPDREQLAELARRFFVSGGQVPPDVEVSIAEIQAFEDTGLHHGDLTLSKDGQSQSLPFHVTGDGRWLFISDPIDLTVDPIQAVLEGISITENDPSLGPADAKVTIVEYSDFQCPFCARAETIIQEDVLAKYGDQVRFVYKQMPLVSIHPWAQPASEIGLCLFQQNGGDAYWQYHGAVFAQQREIPAGGDEANDKLVALAAEAGGDEAAVRDCFAAGDTRGIVEATLKESEALGVASTPTFFINGRKLSGAQPLEAFEAIIIPELQG